MSYDDDDDDGDNVLSDNSDSVSNIVISVSDSSELSKRKQNQK